MLVSLYLILMNTYNTVDAPSGRGFSHIEVWLLGCQIPIIFAILEYGLILTLQRIFKTQIQSWMKFKDPLKVIDICSWSISSIFMASFVAYYFLINK